MKRVQDSRDIFSRSQFYKNTVLYPELIIQPLGYNSITKKSNTQTSKNVKQQIFQHPEDTIYKIFFNRKDTQKQEMLQIQDNCRKNTYLNGQNFSYFQRQQNLIKNKKKNFNWYEQHPTQGSTKILKFIQLLSYTKKHNLLNVQYYTLSNYVYFIDTQNQLYQQYIYGLLNKEFIEYYIKGFYIERNKFKKNFNQDCIPIPGVDITNRQQVVSMIQKINKKNKELDLLYSGIHLFIGISKLNEKYQDYVDQELKYLKYLQYYVMLITGLLGDGQNAIIKIYSNLRHKTNEYLFLLRTMFNKITIIKPLLSSYFSNQKYLICETYKKSAGIKIYNHLYNNYDLLKLYGQQKFLVKSKIILKNEFVSIVNDYNNRLVNKGFKILFDKYAQNSGIKYIPNEKYLRQKLKNTDNIVNVQLLLNTMFKTKQIIKQIQIEQKIIAQIQQGEIKVEEKPSSFSLISLAGIDKTKVVTKEKKEKKQKVIEKQQKWKSIEVPHQSKQKKKHKKQYLDD